MTRFLLRYWSLLPTTVALFVVLRILCTAVDVFVPLATGSLVDAVVAGADNREDEQVWSCLVVLISLVVAFILCRNATLGLNRRIGRDIGLTVFKRKRDLKNGAPARGSSVRGVSAMCLGNCANDG